MRPSQCLEVGHVCVTVTVCVRLPGALSGGQCCWWGDSGFFLYLGGMLPMPPPTVASCGQFPDGLAVFASGSPECSRFWAVLVFDTFALQWDNFDTGPGPFMC